MPLTGPVWISSDEVYARLSFVGAARAISESLRDGLDPSADPPRSIVDVSSGQLLIMPSEFARHVGVKIASVSPNNPARGLQRIQGVYLLLDADTLAPVAQLDGVALTTLRTAAVSAAAADVLAPDRVEHLVVFGSGPQAWGHVMALRAVRPVERVTIVARDRDRAAALADKLADGTMTAAAGSADAVADADLVVCATTARSPLFSGNVRDDTLLIAVGSHEPDARELPGDVVARAQVVVEDEAAALREAGDVMIPVAEGRLDPASLVSLRSVVRGEVPVDRSRPRVFKSVGMSWEDLVIASAIYHA
ncbi:MULTISPECIES: ornithine cyclodeaminase family protein [unclassified Nocardioides]|uniref:ornithine cyclodeaminase family protein n=1 Tax=unclassified Nocardioides TaxID=2615069 RepID=UPI0009F0AD00|nr:MULTISPECIES: ornithine cyclodeaminase family protein [unclassified Nocardioides]GAW50256.1 ornithine cyclodeaminase [Nocardioides sp. PD653-B2]GAW52978.1 ornithine cyclodeaminase [Nocardioides sp. PD653]